MDSAELRGKGFPLAQPALKSGYDKDLLSLRHELNYMSEVDDE